MNADTQHPRDGVWVITSRHLVTTDIATTDIATTDIATTDIATTDIATTDIATKDIATTDIATKDIATTDIATKDIATKNLATKDIATAASVALGIAALVAGCASPAAPRPHVCPSHQVILAGQEDVAALAGCREVAALRIRTGAHLDFSPLATLERIRGAFVIGPTVGVDEIRLPNVVAIEGELATKDYNGDLRGLYLPALVSAQAVRLGDNHALATVSLPRLRELRSFVARRNPALEMIDLSALAAIDELVLVDNGELALVEAPNLATGRRVEIDGVPKLGEDVVERIRALGGR